MDAVDKDRLVEEFRACLDDCDWAAENTDNEAADSEIPVDLALLFAELSVLRNEVRIESRQFKSALDDMRAALDDMRGMTELLREQNQRLSRDLDRARETTGSAQRQSERRLLLDMVDVRDRLEAAVMLFRGYQPSFLARFARDETRLAQGLGEGIELTLRRLDDLLVDRRVRPIEALGGSLDPNCMRAIGVEASPAHAVGTVLREVRRGYLREDELLRPAEVIVNKLESKT